MATFFLLPIVPIPHPEELCETHFDRGHARDAGHLLMVLPATATVRQITGKFCSGGQGQESPPGLSGGSNADNFAKPLVASGAVESVTPFAGDGVNGPGMLITSTSIIRT